MSDALFALAFFSFLSCMFALIVNIQILFFKNGLKYSSNPVRLCVLKTVSPDIFMDVLYL